jgi:hypothetical protein
VLTALTSDNVDFVLIGGLAMKALGSAYMTVDIDIYYRRDRANLRRIVKALASHLPRPRDFPVDLPFVWDAAALGNTSTLTLDTALGKVDLLSEVAGAAKYDDVRNRSVAIKLFEMIVNVVSLDDLIEMKRAAGRTKDRLHLLELEAMRKANLGE